MRQFNQEAQREVAACEEFWSEIQSIEAKETDEGDFRTKAAAVDVLQKLEGAPKVPMVSKAAGKMMFQAASKQAKPEWTLQDTSHLHGCGQIRTFSIFEKILKARKKFGFSDSETRKLVGVAMSFIDDQTDFPGFLISILISSAVIQDLKDAGLLRLSPLQSDRLKEVQKNAKELKNSIHQKYPKTFEGVAMERYGKDYADEILETERLRVRFRELFCQISH